MAGCAEAACAPFRGKSHMTGPPGYAAPQAWATRGTSAATSAAAKVAARFVIIEQRWYA